MGDDATTSGLNFLAFTQVARLRQGYCGLPVGWVKESLWDSGEHTRPRANHPTIGTLLPNFLQRAHPRLIPAIAPKIRLKNYFQILS
jgi:hypothetical protein